MEKERKNREEKVKEITEKIDEGIQMLCEGEEFKAYLDTISKFHSYSINNTILISIQRPQATAVAGFQAWKQKFDRRVKKGEKGIQILAPLVKKQEIIKETEHGKETMKCDIIVGFRTTYVFDIDQTEGKELPSICKPITAEVMGFEEKKRILMELSPVPISFEPMEDRHANGYFNRQEQKIVVKDSLQEGQMLKTMIHEIAHSTLHGERDKTRDRRTEEVQAESIAYTVCKYMGLDTSSYSFAYIADWSEGKELTELKTSMEIIRKSAVWFIEKIEEKQLAIEKEKAKDHALVPKDKQAQEKPKWDFESLRKHVTIKPAEPVMEYER